ncbi:TPA: hypothetical protein N0F65_006799 [Lagenidium giganteum]|uniref:TOG domain-containing protein n=1 Tax=Lagenidium giganteum TaxID=4803 RepID=A0AAV2ZH96_9STRA|nr:TPA: hypothetical protein N0F65_006799 [Lagenidium giganteum]
MAVARVTTRVSERRLRQFVARAAKDVGAPFHEAFAAILSSKCKAFTRSFGAARLLVLRFSTSLMTAALEAQEDAAAVPAWVSDVAAAQSVLLEAMLGDAARAQAAARAEMERVLKRWPSLVPTYVKALVDAPNELQQYHLWLVVRTSADLDAATVEQLLKAYTFWAFESKNRKVVSLAHRDARLQGLTHEQFGAIVKPTMAKMLKKSPDSVLEAVIAFVHAAPLDFGGYVQELFSSVIIAKLRSVKPEVRQYTVALAQVLLNSFQTIDSFSQLVTDVSAVLEGKHGILAQFYMRESACSVLLDAAEVAVTTMSADDLKPVAKVAIAALLKAMDKEAHDPTRHLGLLALGKWIAIAQEIPADAATKIRAGLQNKSEAVVAGYLRALSVVCHTTKSTDLVSSGVAAFADDIIKVLQEANKKVLVLHLDGVLALTVAGSLALASSEMDAKLAQAGVAAMLLDSSSFVEASTKQLLQSLLSDDSALSGVGVEKPEVTALVALPTALSWVLASKQTEPSHAYRVLVELLCSRVLAARCSAELAISALYASSVDHCPGLLQAFIAKLSALADAEQQAIAAAAASKDDSSSLSQRVVPPSGVLRRALRTLVPAAIRDHLEVRDAVFATTLWAAHHPYLVDGKKQTAFSTEWTYLKPRFLQPTEGEAHPHEVAEDEDEDIAETTDDRIDHLIEASEPIRNAMIDLLAQQERGFLYSERAVERLTAHRVLATLLIFAGNGEGESVALHEIVEDLLMKRLDELEIDQITDDQVAVFRAPFDELYVPKKNEDGDETAPSSKRRGGSNRRGNEDEQWEQQVREELQRKKAQEAKGKKVQLTGEQKAQLAEQQALRTRLQGLTTTVGRVLEAVDMLVKAQPEEMHPALPLMLRSFRVLFKTSLFQDESLFSAGLATQALLTLAGALSPEHVRHNFEVVAHALRVVLEAQELESTSAQVKYLEESHGVITRMFNEMMIHVFAYSSFSEETDFDAEAPMNRLQPPTLHMIFPVIRMWLTLFPTSSWRLSLLGLFAAHGKLIPEEEEEEVGDAAAQHMLRNDMVELALDLIAQEANGDAMPVSNEDMQPAHVLSNLCVGVSLGKDEEWTSFFSDKGVLSESPAVRLACLKAMITAVETEDDEERTELSSLMVCRLFCCCFDTEETNRNVAKELWDATDAKLTQLFAGPMLVYLSHPHANVRESGALAIAAGMKQFPETTTAIINNLKTTFLSNLPKPLDLLDEFGIPKVRRDPAIEIQEEPETYLPRCGVALCFEKSVSAGTHSSANVLDVISFVIEHGLGDTNAQVRAQMRKTGMQVVDAFGGGNNTTPLLNIFERLLDKKPGKDPKEIVQYDHQREGVVVFLGSLAKHMDKTDPKVASIVDSLLDAFNIPSESVQRSVAACLSPLVAAVKERSTDILDNLLMRATTGETFGERIGAAFGVSAVVKGLGISALKQHNIIPRLEESMKGGGANARQGAMLVFECLSERLGMLFEPYIIVILPIMLKCFADASTQVRDAANQTSKAIMANLSAHGVKLVLPSLLRALEDSAWRTKQAGIQILGSMAYCAPRQLGSCLPQVVPKLMEALTDSHPRVREAGKAALRDIGSVVRNPEIASISNALLNALEDPNKHTAEALQKLQSTSFVHSIDAPSLALVMPIITRGLKDRAGDAKKKSALIVGSMCTMINDAKDLVPYIEMVLPSLKTQLMDPIPEVRTISAKAMGKLVKGLGEKHFSDILTWLLEAIKGDYGSVERSGAAQGLCEVLVALGKDRVESTLVDEIFPLARHPKFSVREGVLWIIAFLPPALGRGFAVFLREALPIVVAGLSDEAESVRDVAMHAGHVVVNAHALTHTSDILPSLEAGLFDDNWRIRQSSVTLLGDLMYRVSGTRAVGLSEVTAGDVDEDDDAAGSAAGDRAIIKTLGMERRNVILASLYMIRSDTSAVVRQSSLQVWKSVVANTPKTLRQILETLMNTIVTALAGDNVEKQTMAGRTLGELVRKLGENVLPEIVPILRAGLSPNNPRGMRQGVCIGLAEVIDCTTKKQLEDYVDTLVVAIIDGLCDELQEVRSSAAQAFDVLQKSVGYRAIDETVPALLHRIKTSDLQSQERALQGLQEMLRVKSKEVMPYLVPRMLTKPMTAATVRCVSRVAQATGSVIHFQVERIFATLISQYVECISLQPSLAEDIKSALRDVMLSVEDVGVHWLLAEVCKYCESDNKDERVLAFYLVAEFGSHTTTDYHDQTAMLLKQIVLHLNDSEPDVVQGASDALKGLNVTTRPESMTHHLDFIRQSINSMVSDARHRKGGVGDGEYLLPGLCISKGLEPFLPSYQFALMNGAPELRQSAAAGLGELVELSSAASLRPYLIKLTGPLIRIAGDRFPGHVKAAILHTLEILLTKGGVALKPFLPQLQTTFVKALNDTASEVRGHGASALRQLVTLSPRVDPLVAELTEKLKTTSGGIRQANLNAVSNVVEAVGEKMTAAVKAPLEEALVDLLENQEDDVRMTAAQCLARVVLSDAEKAESSTLSYGLATTKDVSSLSTQRRHGAAAFLDAVLVQQPAWAADCSDSLSAVLAQLANEELAPVRVSALQAIGGLIKVDASTIGAFVPLLAQNIAHGNKDVSRAALKVTKRMAKRNPEAIRAHVGVLVPPTFQTIKSNNLAVKLVAERALLYLLQVHSRPETLATYVRTATDAATAKVISEYARRVLAKLKADSGDESD